MYKLSTAKHVGCHPRNRTFSISNTCKLNFIHYYSFTESGRIRYNFVQFSVTRKTYLLLNHVVPRKEQLIICHDFEIKYFTSDLCFPATVKFPSDHLTTTFLKAHSSDYRAKFYATLSKKIDSN